MKKRLYKKSTDKKLCGVCGGLAEYIDVDPTLIRAAYAIITLLTAFFPALIVYIVLAAIMPSEEEVRSEYMNQQQNTNSYEQPPQQNDTYHYPSNEE